MLWHGRADVNQANRSVDSRKVENGKTSIQFADHRSKAWSKRHTKAPEDGQIDHYLLAAPFISTKCPLSSCRRANSCPSEAQTISLPNAPTR
jgi:hypothetical protein